MKKKNTKTTISNKLILFILAGILAGIIIAYLVYSSYFILKVEEWDMDIVVMDDLGVNVDSDALHFGGVPRGRGSSVRNMNINNSYDFPIGVSIFLIGDLARWVIVDKNDILLEPDWTMPVEFKASPPADAEYGNYTGKVKIVYKRILW